MEEGLEVVLDKDIRPGAARLLSALLVSMACSEPPEGRCRWTLQLLADFFVTLTDFDDVSIKRKGIKTVADKMWCIPKFDAEYVAQMEEVLKLYAEP